MNWLKSVVSNSPDTEASAAESEAPLLECLWRARLFDRVSFHMPGHLGGRAWPEELRREWLTLDTTEIAATDNLLAPSENGPVIQAERLAARYWQAPGALFLAQGSTHGLQCVLLYFVGKGGRLLLTGSVHKAVFHIAALLDIELVYLPSFSSVDNPTETPTAPVTHPMPRPASPELLEEHLRRDNEFGAFLCTSPDYYGTFAETEGFAEVLKRYGIPFLLDSAHGAHLEAYYRASGQPHTFEPTCMIMSTHKTLPALTGGAIVLTNSLDHVRGLRRAADFFGSSSPSLMIASSSDFARAYAEHEGVTQIHRLLPALRSFAEGLDPRYVVWPKRLPGALQDRDPLRLVIDVSDVGPGTYVDRALAEAGVVVEMSDLSRIVCIISLAAEPESLRVMQAELNRLAQEDSVLATLRDLGLSTAEDSHPWLGLDKALADRLVLTTKTRHVVPPSTVKKKAQGYVKLEEAIAARLALAADLVPYPPGVTLFFTGETLSSDDAELLRGLLACGLDINGVSYQDGEAYILCFV